MMNDRQLLQMIERLGNNRLSKSLSASDLADRDQDTRCATTLRKIITSNGLGLGTNNKSFAASATIPSSNVNKARVLTQFIFRNGKI